MGKSREPGESVSKKTYDERGGEGRTRGKPSLIELYGSKGQKK